MVREDLDVRAAFGKRAQAARPRHLRLKHGGRGGASPLLLRGERPRLIDEWQVAPVLWDAVINEVDSLGGAPGQFLLTGSVTPIAAGEDRPKHTGTGRMARVSMDPMTLQESGS